jgi:hypothetical protein
MNCKAAPLVDDDGWGSALPGRLTEAAESNKNPGRKIQWLTNAWKQFGNLR